MHPFVLLFIISAIAIWPRKNSIAAKIGLTLAVAAIIFKGYIEALFSGHPFIPPAIPGWLSLIFAWLLFAMLVWAALLLLVGVCRLVRKMRGGAWRTPRDGKVDLWLLASALLVAAWGVYNGNREPEIKRYTVTIPDLPESAKGFKIAVLTDIHVDPRCSAADLSRIVERTNALDADVIALLGDNVDGKFHGINDQLAAKMTALQNLHAKYGVFGVTGNHEYYSGYREWNGFLLDHRVQMLENCCVDLPCKISIAGVPSKQAEKTGDVVADAAKAVANAKYPAILLCHEPLGAKEHEPYGYILQLSGHTHGGLFPGLRKYVADHNDGFVSGWYDVGNMKLYVSDGTGIWGGMPIRFGTRAEITLITLQ